MKEKEFNLIINDLINNETVLEMKKYYQHGSTSCFLNIVITLPMSATRWLKN